MTDSSGQMSSAVRTLEQCFQHVYQTRMWDVPVINSVLEVRALGFRPWHDYWFGALLTPWFINLVLLPRENAVLMPGIGEACRISLPCGEFVFLGCHEEMTGEFLSCSLLSPVNELSSQQQAETIAWEALQAIFEENHTEQRCDDDSKEVERFQINAAVMKLKSQVHSHVEVNSKNSTGDEFSDDESNDLESAENKDTNNKNTRKINELEAVSDRVDGPVAVKSSLVSKKGRISRRRLIARMIRQSSAQQRKQKRLEDRHA